MIIPKMDRYEQEALLSPALATLPPFVLLTYYYLQILLSGFMFALFGIVLGEISLSFVFVKLLMEVNRYIAKMLVENKQFKNELMMPTTDFLLYKNSTYSEDHKSKIRNKIRADFDKTLPSKREESTNELSARQKIVEAVSLVRGKMKGGRLILQHNIHYGFTRNLIGGAYLALFVSTLDFYIFMLVAPNQIASVISLLFIILYGSILVFKKQILNALGKNYAKVLFQEYLDS